MSKSKNQLIVQNAEEFATAAKTMDKTTANFTGENEIEEFKEKMSFFQDSCCAGGDTNSRCQIWSLCKETCPW